MKIAVSGCLLGEKIRYDGGDRRNDFIADELGKVVEFVSFCPEHLAFGTPRPSVRLVKEGTHIHVHTNQDGHDLTHALIEKSLYELNRLEKHSLCGIIFKSKSPSCGMKSTKVYHEHELCDETVDGVFMAMCRERFPLMPMAEEGQLEDLHLRENFLVHVFAYDRFERFKASLPTLSDLIVFHRAHTFLLQAKDDRLTLELENIIANQSELSFEILFGKYELGFKTAISHKCSIECTRNLLEHLTDFFVLA